MGDRKSLFTMLILVGLAGLSFTSNNAGAQTRSVATQTNLGQIEPQASAWRT